MATDPQFLLEVRQHLPLEFFARDEAGGEFLAKGVEIIYQHSGQQEYRNQAPTRLIFSTLCADYVGRLEGTQRQIFEQGLANLTSYLYDQAWTGSEITFVKEHVYSWIRDRASRSLTVEIKKGIDAGRDIEDMNVVERAKEISMIGLAGKDSGIELFGDDDTTWRWLNTKEFRATLSTGSPAFDRVMVGGYGRKELTTYIAPPNVGKTTLMCDQTSKLVSQTRSGIYISLEQSALLIMQKIISSLVNLPPEQWLVSDQNIQAIWAWVQYLKNSGTKLAIRQLAANRASTRDIEAYILTVAQQWGRMPDFVVVDYADLARPLHRYENVRHQLAEIYTDLRSIALEYNLSMVTASQANRGAVGADRIGIEDIAEAFDKAAISDVMIAICQTDEEQQRDRARLFWAKNRVGRKFVELPINVNYALARIQEDEQRMGMNAAAQQAADQFQALNNIMGGFAGGAGGA